MKLKVAVIDGQGGGMGEHIIKKLRQALSDNVEILALGTNALAVAAMMKAGADRGASGENAIIISVSKVDYILGTITIIAPNSMMGEITTKMAEAVVSSSAKKILLPVNTENIEVVGVRLEPLPNVINIIVSIISKSIKDASFARSGSDVLTS